MASAGNETSTVEVPTENSEAEDLDVFVKELMDNSKSLLLYILFYMIHFSVVIFLPYRMLISSIRSGELRYTSFIAMQSMQRLKIN